MQYAGIEMAPELTSLESKWRAAPILPRGLQRAFRDAKLPSRVQGTSVSAGETPTYSTCLGPSFAN